ncbi:MAG: phosphoribosylanthranilate isomerase [Bacteroidales bacterium]|nr:phosphoribosylanthranilate isomerase [Bacteroidales bacterium]
MKIKVCGLKNPENMSSVDRCEVDYVGMIFYSKSKRFVENVMPPTFAERVGVFVNESKEIIDDMIKRYNLSVIQLHGSEKPEFCRLIKENGAKVIKAISIEDESDIELSYDYQNDDCCDFLLFDTKCKTYGGSGRQFDWSIVENYKGRKPFFISGGIGVENAGEIKKIRNENFYGVDLNSRFEIEPGIKNIPLLKKFIEEIRK